MASFHSKNKIGLYRAISDVIKSEGSINISSFDSEILWRPKIWEYIDNHQSLDDILKLDINKNEFYINGFVDVETLNNGYFKKYDHFLMGSRITFEIPFSHD